MLIGVAFVLFMGVFIKCCAVHTPSSNPKKSAALSISQTLRHPYSTLRRKRHHPQQQQPPHVNASAPYIAAPNPAGGSHGEPRSQYNRPKGKTSITISISSIDYVLIIMNCVIYNSQVVLQVVGVIELNLHRRTLTQEAMEAVRTHMR